LKSLYTLYYNGFVEVYFISLMKGYFIDDLMEESILIDKTWRALTRGDKEDLSNASNKGDIRDDSYNGASETE
jgi:hypothetical protein